MSMKRMIYFILVFLMPFCINAQVTTSSITGTAQTSKGEFLEGATVTATHQPSGTTYSTVAKKGGSFTLPNLRVGGPYTVQINFVGLKPQTLEGINLQLGEPYNIAATLNSTSAVLENVTVNTRRSGALKTGTSTVISSRQLATLPSISRGISDFTRLTPQASGNNFAGRDARYNN